MASISDETCRDRQEACKTMIYSSINKRVTWAVLMALLSLLGAGIAFSVSISLSRASVGDVQRAEAIATKAADVATESRVSLAALQEAILSIRSEQARAAERDQEQARRLDAILRALEDHK